MNNIQAYHCARQYYQHAYYVDHISKVVMFAYHNLIEAKLPFFEDIIVCCYLHDLIEDGLCTTEDLRNNGLTNEQAHSLACVTRITGESYRDFLKRCCSDEVATYTKFCDISQNYQRCIVGGSYDRASYYLGKLQYVLSILKEYNESRRVHNC